MTLKTEHKGMVIYWSDNADEWSCMELNYSSKSLASVRAKIDAFRLKERKALSVAAIYIGYGSTEDAEIVEYLGPKGYKGAHKVAVLRERGGKKRSRSEEEFKDLTLDLPETRAALERAAVLRAKAREIVRQADEIVSAIPRINLDDIAALIEHANCTETAQ